MTKPERVVMETPDSIAKSERIVGKLGAPFLWLVSEMRVVLQD